MTIDKSKKKFDDKMTENNREPVPQPKYIPSIL